MTVEAVSDLYETAAMGQPRQPPYLNAVALLSTSLPAPALLRLLKQIEAHAGRRGGRPWGARTLDLDILDYKGLAPELVEAQTRPARSTATPLVLPHPELDQRALRAQAAARRRPELAPSGAEGERRGSFGAVCRSGAKAAC